MTLDHFFFFFPTYIILADTIDIDELYEQQLISCSEAARQSSAGCWTSVSVCRFAAKLPLVTCPESFQESA